MSALDMRSALFVQTEFDGKRLLRPGEPNEVADGMFFGCTSGGPDAEPLLALVAAAEAWRSSLTEREVRFLAAESASASALIDACDAMFGCDGGKAAQS